MKRLKYNYLPILITLTLCLVGLSCRKENSAVVDSTPTLNEQITSRSDEEIIFVAQIVARRTDPMDFTSMGMYYQEVFNLYPDCQTILYDANNLLYFGCIELAPADAIEMVGYPGGVGPNGNFSILQPQSISIIQSEPISIIQVDSIPPPCVLCELLRKWKPKG